METFSLIFERLQDSYRLLAVMRRAFGRLLLLVPLLISLAFAELQTVKDADGVATTRLVSWMLGYFADTMGAPCATLVATDDPPK